MTEPRFLNVRPGWQVERFAPDHYQLTCERCNQTIGSKAWLSYAYDLMDEHDKEQHDE